MRKTRVAVLTVTINAHQYKCQTQANTEKKFTSGYINKALTGKYASNPLLQLRHLSLFQPQFLAQTE